MTAPLPSFVLPSRAESKEAIAARREQPGSRFIAGGTDLLVNMRHGITSPELLIDLSGIDELAEIRADRAGVRIGAGVTIAALARHAGDRRALSRACARPPRQLPARAIALWRPSAAICASIRAASTTIRANGGAAPTCYCLKNRGDICHVAPQGQRCHAAFTGDLAPRAAGSRRRGRDRRPTRPPSHSSERTLCRRRQRSSHAWPMANCWSLCTCPANPPPSAYAKVRVRGAIDFPLAGVAVALAATGVEC